MPDDLEHRYPRRGEPLFNVPWTLLVLVGLLLATHLLRVALNIDPDRFALRQDDLDQGRWFGLISHMFVHGGWAHVGVNSAFCLAFGAPVARYLGLGWRGALTFMGFFLTSGVLAALSYAGLLGVMPVPASAPDAAGAGGWALVGASGAVSGFMGAAARLIQGRGQPGPIVGPVVVSMTLAWIVINAVLGLTGLTPGTAGAPVAWQAHIFGFLAGLLLIRPAGWLAKGSRADHE